MRQNREVGGATMGAQAGTTVRNVTFGPFGFLNLGAAVMVASALLWGMADWHAGILSFGLVWITFPGVLLLIGIGRLASARGGETDRAYRAGPRDLAYRVQQWAPWAAIALLLVGLVGIAMNAPVLTIAMVAATCGMTAGVAPVYFLPRPGRR